MRRGNSCGRNLGQAPWRPTGNTQTPERDAGSVKIKEFLQVKARTGAASTISPIQDATANFSRRIRLVRTPLQSYAIEQILMIATNTRVQPTFMPLIDLEAGVKLAAGISGANALITSKD
jgi:hypothetical protein